MLSTISCWISDETDKELVVHVPGKTIWSEETYLKFNSFIKINKEEFKKITKKKNLSGLMMKVKLALCISY